MSQISKGSRFWEFGLFSGDGPRNWHWRPHGSRHWHLGGRELAKMKHTVCIGEVSDGHYKEILRPALGSWESTSQLGIVQS